MNTILKRHFHTVILASLALTGCKTLPPAEQSGAASGTTTQGAKQATREKQTKYRPSTKAPQNTYTDIRGCSGQFQFRQTDLNRFRFTHDCPNGQANGDGFSVWMEKDGFPTTIKRHRFINGQEASTTDKKNLEKTMWKAGHAENFVRTTVEESILLALKQPSVRQPGAFGEVLLQTLGDAQAQGSKEASRVLAWLADNADAALLAQLKPYLSNGSETTQRIEQRSVANKATCNTEALAEYSKDYLRIVNYKVKNNQAYDSLAQSLEIRLSNEAQRDQMQTDLRLAEMKTGVAKVRTWLRGAKHANGTPPTLVCSFVTVWTDKYSGFVGSMNSYGYNKLSLGVSRDVLGNQAVVPVVVAPPTHIWAQQVQERSGLQTEAKDFAVEDSFKYPSYCGSGCRETTQHRIAFSPILPEHARAIREIAMAAKGQRLGVKTMGPPDPNLKFQIVQEVTFFNPDNPTQQLTLKGVSGKVD